MNNIMPRNKNMPRSSHRDFRVQERQANYYYNVEAARGLLSEQAVQQIQELCALKQDFTATDPQSAQLYDQILIAYVAAARETVYSYGPDRKVKTRP